MEFEWDENKIKSNQAKHRIDFNDAKEVYKDENGIISPDLRNDYGENRWKIIGKIYGSIISVIYTMRDKIRIISARKASKIEVSEELVYYNDDAIDFSDDPDLTDNDLESGKIVWNIKTSLPVDKELKDWIVREKIDVDKLLIKLMRNFYQTVKDFPKKAAL